MAFQEGLAPSPPFLSSAWQKLHSWYKLPRIWGTISPISQSRAKVSPWEGQAANFSHLTYSSVLQNVIPGKYSQEVWSTFTHLAISYNIEAVTQAWQAKSTGTLITFTLVSSQSEGSTQENTSPKGQRLPFPLDAHLVVSFWERQGLPLSREVVWQFSKEVRQSTKT